MIVSCFMLLAVPIAAEAAGIPFALMMPNCYSVPARACRPSGPGSAPPADRWVGSATAL